MTSPAGGGTRPGPDAGALLDANTAFYDAFESLDLDRMSAEWAHDDEVWCVHPGADRVTGWAAVRRSWAAVFAASTYLQFIVTDVVARPSAGVVTCVENVLSGRDRDPTFGAGLAVATNLWTPTPRGWRMIAHHASPVARPALA